MGYLVLSKDIGYNVMLWNFAYNVMSRWQGNQKKERESDNERILKSMMTQNGEMCFFIHFLF